MKILTICGSLQTRSANRALLDLAVAITRPGVDVTPAPDVAAIPAFNPDIAPEPDPVGELRAAVAGADAVMIATPEYAHGLPGALKNALDWLVGTGELYEKPVAIVSAAPSAERGVHARTDLERTLRAQGARVRASVTIVVPTGARGTEADDPDLRAAVGRVLDALVAPPAP